MSFSVPHIESRTQFTPLPQHDNQIQVNNNNNNNPHVVIEQCEEQFDWDSVVIMLRLALVGTLLMGLSLRQTPIEEPNPNTVPPKFFLDAIHVPNFKVSNGNLSSTWYMTLTISNVMNDSNINILKLDAAMFYKENLNDTMALKTPIIPQYALQRVIFSLEGEETKRVHLKLNTTGREEDQAIEQDMQRGVAMFSLYSRVIGEVEYEDGCVAHFTMYPICNDLRVKFVGKRHKGEVIDSMPRECVGLVQWGLGRDKSEIPSRKTLEKY